MRNINMQSDRSGKRLEGCGWGEIRRSNWETVGPAIDRTNKHLNKLYSGPCLARPSRSFISTDRRRRQVSQLVAARQPRKVIISTTGHRSFHSRRRRSELMLVSLSLSLCLIFVFIPCQHGKWLEKEYIQS